MRRSIRLPLACTALAVIAAPATAQMKPGRAVAAPAAPSVTMPSVGDGKTDVAVAFERMILSDDLRAAVRAKDAKKIDAILTTLTVVVPSGPVNQVLCPPPRIILGGRCTLPVTMQMNAGENQK